VHSAADTTAEWTPAPRRFRRGAGVHAAVVSEPAHQQRIPRQDGRQHRAGNGAVRAATLPRDPLLVDRRGLNPRQCRLAVACYAAGSLLSSGLPAALIARFGAHRVVIGGTVLLGLAAATTAWSVNGLMMAICLLLLGCCDAIVDVAQNVVGIAVQERLQ